MNWNRILSSLVAVLYIIVGYGTSGAEAAFKVGLFVILPLACIWYADAMGGYVGPTGHGSITGTSPGLVVCILGWLILLLPFITSVL